MPVRLGPILSIVMWSSRVAEGPEYPKAVYRDGGTDEIWGAMVETSVCGSFDEEMEALAHGWRLHPIANDEPLTFTQSDEPTPRRRGRPPLNRTPLDA